MAQSYKVRSYPTTEQDLAEIVNYLNTLSRQAALAYYDMLTEEIASLSTMPERYPHPRDLALTAKGYRYLEQFPKILRKVRRSGNRMTSLSSLTGVSPPASSALSCNPRPHFLFSHYFRELL